jgi:hypothetical protein
VILPMRVMCASVAFVGEFLTMVLRGTPSHASRSVGLRVLPSRRITLNAAANSDCRITNRLSATPSSSIVGSDSPFLPVTFLKTGSRTALITPSPLDSPEVALLSQSGSMVRKNVSTGAFAEPLRPVDVEPTPQMNRLGKCLSPQTSTCASRPNKLPA